MAVCARAIIQQDGSALMALDQTAQDLTTCQYVVESGAELGNSMLSMTATDGAIYSGEIVACWVAAFSIRAIAQIIKGSENA